jgi:hypothetical protein
VRRGGSGGGASKLVMKIPLFWGFGDCCSSLLAAQFFDGWYSSFVSCTAPFCVWRLLQFLR